MSQKLLQIFFLLGATVLIHRLQAAPQEYRAAAQFRGLPVRSPLGDPSIENKVEALLKQMTLEEKVGQLVQYSVGTPTGPGTGRSDYEDMVARGQVGSLFNLDGAGMANRFQHIAIEKSRLHIPLLFGLDVIHGYRTTFPMPLALASTWDPAIVERAARIAAQESAAAGVRWTFSPMVDIARDPRWGRMTEGAGEDPYLGSVMARAYVRGYQGKSLGAGDSIAACVKHYAGYGAAEGGRDYNTVEISEHTLRAVYLPPFYAALDEGAASIMSAFNPLNGVPASANPFTLTQILRREWQFPGLAVSDWTAIVELIAHGIANDGETAARKALAAGVDMDMESNLYHEHLLGLVESGKVSRAQLDEAVRRVLRVKFALGLFERPYTDEARENHGPLPPESLQLARRAAERSFVLLKNDVVASRRLLPLAEDARTIALIGPLADDAANMLGSWAGRGDPHDVVTLRAALLGKVGEKRLKYAEGGEIGTSTDAQIDEAVAAARAADVVILALGESGPEMTGEAGSRAHLTLPGRQEELLEKVAAVGKPVVLVLFSGRPLTLPWAFENIPAVMAAWFPGVQAGPALVNVLFGETAPSGKLAVSWPRSVGQIPTYYNALNTGRPADGVNLFHPPKDSKEKYVSRYIDEPNAPQFPFGYGLSYTDFAFTRPQLTTALLSAKKLNESLRRRTAERAPVVTVSVNVTNTGALSAEEVVQLYVRLQGTSVEEPVRKLQGFQRLFLKAGETKKVSFALGPEAFALWDIANEWKVEPSRVHIWVSPDSASGEASELEIAQ
ncbi:MAG TPA: glycoside hydrolase family 3 N-terminal domain-containing protein [Candidatus Sulfotelmatobacter sp.]|nr:glycoside hydrolase family 3 N-terminal domain-containing protein [Candidatus Sulfotelmatobacter sp.]